jgi:hypothetical protein
VVRHHLRHAALIAVLLGITIGVGLLAKYAMIYFALGMAIQAMFSAEARLTLRENCGLVLLLGALVMDRAEPLLELHAWLRFVITARFRSARDLP